MKERPIQLSKITGLPSKRGKRLKSTDGLSFRIRNKDAVNARRRQLYTEDKKKHQIRASKYRRSNLARIREKNRPLLAGYRARIRQEMIAAYGQCCACCGESEPKFLQLDHIFNDGHLDRKINKTSCKLAASLKRQGWPKDRHQLLCANCNFGKLMNKGTCPHSK